MRTTLVIPDAVYERAKAVAKEQGKTLSALFTESVEIQLARKQQAVNKKKYRLRPVSMGIPRVDPNDLEALYRAMEE